MEQRNVESVKICSDKKVYNPLPSGYKSTYVIIAPLMKFGGVAARTLLLQTSGDVRIVWVSEQLILMEGLRSQLPDKTRERFFCYGCDIKSGAGVTMTTLRLARQFDRIDVIIHLLPKWNSDDCPGHLRTLICANDINVERFMIGFQNFYDHDIKYVKFKHSLQEDPYEIAEEIVKIAKS